MDTEVRPLFGRTRAAWPGAPPLAAGDGGISSDCSTADNLPRARAGGRLLDLLLHQRRRGSAVRQGPTPYARVLTPIEHIVSTSDEGPDWAVQGVDATRSEHHRQRTARYRIVRFPSAADPPRRGRIRISEGLVPQPGQGSCPGAHEARVRA
jgi:hypothetical protein